jgi:hypothetical protein
MTQLKRGPLSAVPHPDAAPASNPGDLNQAAHDLQARLNVHAEALNGLSIMSGLSVSGESGSMPGDYHLLMDGVAALAEILARDARECTDALDELTARGTIVPRHGGAR